MATLRRRIRPTLEPVHVDHTIDGSVKQFMKIYLIMRGDKILAAYKTEEKARHRMNTVNDHYSAFTTKAEMTEITVQE